MTPNTFSLIGQRPLLGRDFRADDAMPEANKVAILSYGLWQTRYGGDPSILGTAVTLSAESYTIVGIMPRDMEFPDRSTLWVPIVDTAENRDSWYFRSGFEVIGRLPSAVPPLQAETELRAIAGRIAAGRSGPGAGIEPVVLPYIEWGVNPRRKLMGQTLMGAVSFVLLIACANVANLLLSRAVHRSRETSIRVALGASRWRIVRQLLIESVLLSMLGGAVGLGFTLIFIRLFVVAIQPIGIPYWVDWSMDATSFVYLLVICVMSGVLFGLAPALQISRTDVTEGLKETGRQATGGSRTRLLTHALVVAEISLTLVLMVGAGLLVRSLFTLQTVDLGFRTANRAHHDRAARRAEVSGARGSRGIRGSAHRTSRLAARCRVVHDRIRASCEWRRADVSAPGRPRDCQFRGHAATRRNNGHRGRILCSAWTDDAAWPGVHACRRRPRSRSRHRESAICRAVLARRGSRWTKDSARAGSLEHGGGRQSNHSSNESSS